MTIKRNYYAEAGVLAAAATAGSYLLALHFHWLATINWLEVFAVFTAYVAVYLSVVQRRFTYVAGVASVTAFALLFFFSGLYASTALNLYLIPIQLYGWYRWGEDASTRPVTRVAWRWWPVYAIATAAAYWGAATVSEAFGGALVWTDAVVLVATILAQFLLDNKKIETWVLWAVVNAFAIITYAQAHLYLTAFQYVIFLANTVLGYYVWRRCYVPVLRPAVSLAADHGSSAADPVR